MPQMQLPIFPDGVEHINAQLAYEKGNGQVTYLALWYLAGYSFTIKTIGYRVISDKRYQA